MKDQSESRLHPVESKYISAAAVVAFLLTLLLTGGSLIAAFGALALIAGLGWVVHRLLRWRHDALRHDIPQRDNRHARMAAAISKNAQSRGVEGEMLPLDHWQADPSRCQDTAELAMEK